VVGFTSEVSGIPFGEIESEKDTDQQHQPWYLDCQGTYVKDGQHLAA
jgi:hypothetical protein